MRLEKSLSETFFVLVAYDNFKPLFSYTIMIKIR